ncbi:MAG: Gfo/Idh/MocA family protein [Puniceicoccaceae bacterium]
MKHTTLNPSGTIDRRDFIRKTAVGTAGLAMMTSASSYASVVGANDKVRVAVIGLKRRGIPLMKSMAQIENVAVTCICEVDDNQMAKGLEEAQLTLGYLPATEKDMRAVVEREDVDAVVITTPDHWHAYGTMIALQNGKHVYVEKPCSHNLAEDDFLMALEEKYSDLKIQMGTQQRSSPETMEIIKAIHEGAIGDPYKALAFYSNGRGEVPVPQQVEVPPHLDWELWQGPAPRRPFLDILEDYNWHWDWHYGTAESANNGTHEMDVARWALGVEYPEHVQAQGGKYHFVDDGWAMYDTMLVTFRFPGGKELQWDGKSRNGYTTYGSGRGTIVYGTEGSVYVDRGGYRLFSRKGELLEEKIGGTEAGVALGGGGDLTTSHVRNFIDAIRGNAALRTPMAIGAVSTHLTHYTNVASRVEGNQLEIDAKTGKFTDKAVMKKYWGRDYEPGWELTL